MPDALVRPAAVFLDFGGVLTEVHKRDAGYGETAQRVGRLLHRCGITMKAEALEEHIRAGSRAFEAWKRAQSRAAAPHEPSHREFWDLFVTADWPANARAAVASHASELCEVFEAATVARPPKVGARELLESLAALQLPTALICNTLSGNGTRRLVREYGFDGLLSIELYSDEQGLRKPNPEIFSLALTALDQDPCDVWYVGDKLDRDILAARRAGLGAAILMAPQTLVDNTMPGLAPDALVRHPRELRELVQAHVPQTG